MTSARVIDADPVVGELQVRVDRDLRHMTTDTTSGTDGRAMHSPRMTSHAACVIVRRRGSDVLMWIVTCQTRKSAVTVPETRGTMQIGGFVANIPRVAPVPVVVQIARLPMACAAQGIRLSCRQPLGVLNRLGAPRFGVGATWAMARFAMDSRLARLHLKPGGKGDWSSRMAAEAA